ncbi:MAG: hypothetical protein AB8G26_04780 [Ilumatobacter sp.]
MSETTATTRSRTLTRAIAILWLIWALFHVLPGILAMTQAIGTDMSWVEQLEPTAEPAELVANYPTDAKAMSVLYGQHGFNLMWFGIVTLVCSILIWRSQHRIAMLFAAVVAGFADLGVIFFIDIVGGYASLAGTAILAVAVLAIALSVRHELEFRQTAAQQPPQSA